MYVRVYIIYIAYILEMFSNMFTVQNLNISNSKCWNMNRSTLQIPGAKHAYLAKSIFQNKIPLTLISWGWVIYNLQVAQRSMASKPPFSSWAVARRCSKLSARNSDIQQNKNKKMRVHNLNQVNLQTEWAHIQGTCSRLTLNHLKTYSYIKNRVQKLS